MTDITQRSRKYYLFFNLPIQIIAIVLTLTVPFNWKYFLFFYVLIYWIGIQCGSHKLFSHRSWEPRFKFFRYIIAVISCFGLMSGPITWSLVHRYHHAHSDTDKDPHSPKSGIYHSYFGWLMNPPTISAVMIKDYLRDSYLLWIDRYCKEIVFFIVIILGIIDLELMTAMLLAMVVTFHFEMIINAFFHRKVNNEWSPVNISALSFFSGGGSLHANHHESPKKFTFSKFWWQVDPSAWIIIFLKK
jgi:fatty-acid desaturase